MTKSKEDIMFSVYKKAQKNEAFIKWVKLHYAFAEPFFWWQIAMLYREWVTKKKGKVK